MTKKELAQVLAVLSAAYPRWEITEELPVVYYDLLGDLDIAVLRQAAREWAMVEKWPPTIADLRQKAASICGYLAPTSGQAWAEIMAAIQNGSYNSWSHPSISKAVRQFGLQEIRFSDNLSVTRAQFLKVYAEIEKQTNQQVILSPKLEIGAANDVSRHQLPPYQNDVRLGAGAGPDHQPQRLNRSVQGVPPQPANAGAGLV